MERAEPKESASPPTAVYVHVPFCRHRCGYCDFTLIAGRDDLVDRYLAALDSQFQELPAPQPVQTIFLGGGTPSHLSPRQLDQLLASIRRWFPSLPNYEWSLEANPLDITPERVAVLQTHGVNRVSLGVQSFHPDIIHTLERDHSGADAHRAIQLLKAASIDVALDLIFGVPGQTLEIWKDSLNEATTSGVTHISTYGLTFEKGTPFWTRRARGTLTPVPEETEREMYQLAMDLLPAAGFDQYELSNFSAPTSICRHNCTYWRGEAYFGFGPGAARYFNGTRSLNHRSVTTWLHRVEQGLSPLMETETLDHEDRARELIFLGLRQACGIERLWFQQRTGFDLEDLAKEAIDRNVARGWLESTATGIRLTREGRFVADTVISDFL